jgi:hypothetical protein
MAASELWLYRADADQLKPVWVHCPEGRYPAKDADGQVVYINSHFDTEAAAWKNLLDNSEAGVRLAGSQVKRAKQQLLEANQDAADQAAEFATVRDNYRDWQRARENMEPIGEECDE